MVQKRKSFWTQLIMLVAVLCCMFGAWFTCSVEKDKTVAKAEETLDVTDLVTITHDDWMSDNATDCKTFSIRINNAGGGYLYEYLVANSSIKGCWNDNGTKFAATNGIDIMEYLYFNGESARSIVNKNKNGTTSYTGTTFPLSIGGQYSPIAIETTGSFTKMMVLNDWMAQDGFTITIKSGFKLLLNDGKTITTVNDISFQYVNGAIMKVQAYTLSFEGLDDKLSVIGGQAIGTLPAVPEKDGYIAIGWKIDGALINADTVYAYSEDKLAEAVYTPIEYTITIVRANGAEEHIVFNVGNKDSKLAEVTLTAENEDYFYVWAEALPETLELQNYTFTEVAMQQPERTRFVSQSLSIGKDFTLNIYVKVIGDVPPAMQVSGNERAETVDGELVDEALNKYVYKVKNISAAELSTVFALRLIEGEESVDEMECSAEGYFVALSQKEISTPLKTLIADIVCYAQAAEALVGKEDGMRTIDGLTASVYTDLTETDYKQTQGAKAGVEITSAYLSVTDTNRITIRFMAESVGNLVVKVNGKTVEFNEVETGSGVYQAQTDALYIVGCNDRVKVVISVGETAAQTLIYSVKSYVYERQNGGNEEAAAYAKALYNCSASLSAYAEGV